MKASTTSALHAFMSRFFLEADGGSTISLFKVRPIILLLLFLAVVTDVILLLVRLFSARPS